MQTIDKSFLFVKIHDSSRWPDPQVEIRQIPVIQEFFQNFHTQVTCQHGQVQRWIRKSAMAVFDQVMPAVQAAIAIQEEIEKQRLSGKHRLYCKIGIATGSAHACTMPDGSLEFLGATPEQSARLAEQAHGNAILLDTVTCQQLKANHERHPQAWVGSHAGRHQNRDFDAYFHRISPLAFSPYPHPDIYALFWQAHDPEYVTSLPVAPQASQTRLTVAPGRSHGQTVVSPGHQPGTHDRLHHVPEIMTTPPAPGIRHFGKVTAFKKERGFGFIQFYTEQSQYAEIYVHMTYVISQVPLKEHDHVQFAIQPGKGGRPQACSVLVMGSRMRGEVESLQADGSGHLTIRDHDNNLIRFYLLPGQPGQAGKTAIAVGDNVEFTVGSGSEAEGLTATEVTLPDAQTPVDSTSIGEELNVGETEQAIVTTYFADKGYGFAKCRRNNIYLHVSELLNPDEILQQGEMIRFYVSPGRDGTYRAQEIRKISRPDPTSET
ncbi:MAG: cold shock domain-containing protein [Magnetococcales bacterium]|nr:cold shock domain-containing protein [Magnetococcales bacterium]